jgi:hypothetical protein
MTPSTSTPAAAAALPYAEPGLQPSFLFIARPVILYKVLLATEPSCDNAPAPDASSLSLPAAVLTCIYFRPRTFRDVPGPRDAIPAQIHSPTRHGYPLTINFDFEKPWILSPSIPFLPRLGGCSASSHRSIAIFNRLPSCHPTRILTDFTSDLTSTLEPLYAFVAVKSLVHIHNGQRKIITLHDPAPLLAILFLSASSDLRIEIHNGYQDSYPADPTVFSLPLALHITSNSSTYKSSKSSATTSLCLCRPVTASKCSSLSSIARRTHRS